MSCERGRPSGTPWLALAALVLAGCGGDGAVSADAPDAREGQLDARPAGRDAGTADAGPPSAADQAAARALCDGRDGLRFQFSLITPRPVPGSEVLLDNGVSFLLVDGHCRYWVSRSPWDDVASGTLDGPATVGLAQALHLADLEKLHGLYRSPDTHDTPTWFFSDGKNPVAFSGLRAMPGDTPAPVLEMLDRITGLQATLAAAGQPINGPMRITVVKFGPDNPERAGQTDPWPVAEVDPAAIAVYRIKAAEAGSTLVTAPDSVKALRALRAKLRAKGDAGWWWGFIAIAPGPSTDVATYALYARDAVPLENDKGLVLFPP